MASRIENYALIGDCETAALVARDGSIDWLCFPRFDSGSCFAALLGTPDNGCWSLAPVGEVRGTRRRYRDRTLILETEFETDEGVVTLIDWMPPRSAKTASSVMRMVEGKRGIVRMRMDLRIRFDYGSVVPWVRRTDDGIRATAGPDSLRVYAATELCGQDYHTTSDFTVSAGQRIPFELIWFPTYGTGGPRPADAEQSLADTESWWRNWCRNCTYEGEWQEAVIRSLITLKALTYDPTGGLVAAPTTSLPERIGGVRNWDYRFCWLRDATFTLYALTLGGFMEEARRWREWLVNAVAGMPSRMQIMYGLGGERRLSEMELSWLHGYEGASPVRIGNAAHSQLQLDVFGEVMDALYVAERAGMPPNENGWRVQLGLLEYLARAWKKPDHGIWEIRGDPQHFTHSKVMAWVAFDRAIKSVEVLGRKGPLHQWRRLHRQIREEVCTRGFDSGLNSFVQYYGSRELDASLLMLPIVGFLPASDPRMLGTISAIKDQLMHHGFVRRYPTAAGTDGLPPGEGVFLTCSFWLADNLALQGHQDEARDLFERLLNVRNDVGLLSEEYDPDLGRMLGNFPQAFSHVGLINTARNLTKPGGPAEHRQGAPVPVTMQL